MRKGIESKIKESDHKPFQPAIGNSLPVDEVSTLEERSRGFVTRAVVSSLMASMICAAVVSLSTGSYMPLTVVWSIAGPIVGSLVGYYFKDRKERR